MCVSKIISQRLSFLLCGSRATYLALVAGLLLAAGPAFGQGCPKLIASGNPEYSPYLWRDPADDTTLIGANADLMQLLAKEIGIPIEVKYVGPWSRVQELTRAGRVDLIAGAFFTNARLEYMDYFQPAFRGTKTVIWTNPHKSFGYKGWSDLRNRNGLTVVNNSFGQAFDDYAKKNLTIATVGTLEQALQMLVRERADYLIYEEGPGLALAAKLGIKNLKTSDTAISTEGLFLTMSQLSPCNTGELRGRIAKAILKLSSESVIKPLVDSNIQLWRKQNTN